MGLLDKLRERLTGAPQGHTGFGNPAPARQDPDQAAIERYRYMLRTAPPDQIEQAHAEAFAKLTPEQRQRVLDDVGETVPESERARSTDPRDLARMSTRAEMRNPGTMERTLDGGVRGGGMGMGGVIAGSLLAGVAGAFVGTAIADAMFGDESGGEDLAAGEPPAEDPGAFDDGGFGEF